MTRFFAIVIFFAIPFGVYAAQQNTGYLASIISLLLDDEGPKDIDIEIIMDASETAIAGTVFDFQLRLSEVDLENYTLELLAPDPNVAIFAGGNVRYTVPLDAESGNIELELRISNHVTGHSQIVLVEFYIAASEVVASGTVGALGGSVFNDWQDIVVTVPENAVATDSTFRVLRSLTKDGEVAHRVTSSQPLLKLLNLIAPREKADPGVSAKIFPDELIFWEDWSGTFLQIRSDKIPGEEFAISSWDDPINRIPSGSENRLPSHSDISTFIKQDAASLYSLCGEVDEYAVNCNEREPVLFVHGFTREFDNGGGENTWGKFPELLSGGYAVFEFRWQTNTTFGLAANDLASAIEKIASVSGKKVHIVAHSFGGILARTYLQDYATVYPYMDNVASLVTLGTPHSGIFDAVTSLPVITPERQYPIGQDSPIDAFKFCLQFSCYEAGAYSDATYTIAPAQPIECMYGSYSPSAACEQARMLAKTNNPIDSFPDEVGLDAQHGSLIHKLHSNDADHALPVPMLVLIGLTIDRNPLLGCHNRDDRGNQGFGDRFENGDALISFAGQRFNHDAGNSLISPAEIETDDPEVTIKEYLLGLLDQDVAPGFLVSDVDSFHDFTGECSRIGFRGYKHTSKVGLLRGDAREAHVKDTAEVGDTGRPHDSLTQVFAWLGNHTADAYSATPLMLSTLVIDSDTEEPIEGVEVEFYVQDSRVGSGTSDSEGRLMAEVDFIRDRRYTAYVRASEYRDINFNPLFVLESLPATYLAEYPTIRLQKDVLAQGNLSLSVSDRYSNAPIASADIRLSRNGFHWEGITSSAGVYNLTGLVRGYYQVTLAADGYDFSNTQIYVNASQTNARSISMTRKDFMIKLNDTGADFGANYPTGNNADCTGVRISTQDCASGRDQTYDDDSDGHAGFSFTKLDAGGEELPSAASSWACVRDNVTGLIWEVKTTDVSPHNLNNKYRWGGLTAEGFTHPDRSGDYFDDWNTLVNHANQNSFCGRSSWRVPTRDEFTSIVNHGATSPSIDSTFFPNTSSNLYWTSSADYLSSNSAWYLVFTIGNTARGNRSFDGGRVRLVHSE